MLSSRLTRREWARMLASVALVIAIAVGCRIPGGTPTPPIGVELDATTGMPIVHLVSCNSDSVALSRLDVLTHEGGESVTLWSLEAVSGPVQTDQVLIGSVPHGFEEADAVAPLPSDRDISVRIYYGAHGTLAFRTDDLRPGEIDGNLIEDATLDEWRASVREGRFC